MPDFVQSIKLALYVYVYDGGRVRVECDGGVLCCSFGRNEWFVSAAALLIIAIDPTPRYQPYAAPAETDKSFCYGYQLPTKSILHLSSLTASSGTESLIEPELETM